MRILLFVIAICIVFPAFGQRGKKKEDEETNTVAPVYVEGVIYSLPQTGIRIHVEAIKTDFVAGPYAPFAEQLLGIKDVKTQSQTRWKLGRVYLETFSEPDPRQVYKAMGNIASLISLTPEGCIAGINTADLPARNVPVVTNPVSHSTDDSGLVFTDLSDLPFFTAVDSTSNSRAVHLSIEQKAAQTASRILECRKMSFELVAGYLDVLPPDGRGYEASLGEFDKLEKEYLSLFIGKSSSRDYDFSFEYIPSETANKGDVVFRFSEDKGVLEKSDLSGKPVMIEVSGEESLSDNYAKLKKSENPDAGDSGMYYRQPGVADVKLIYELKTIATAHLTIAQFGSVAPVPENFLNGNYSVEFHPETGAIKNIIQNIK